ncbi:ATP-dependent DNA helicase RecG [Gottschalkia purinilytica]|uniref:ATP-dependent DNA helicase RecG n=1 Tax=Gottschalkia purinilytica TaxID=1503 RepID=A0A0L0WB45_GOTPU|nr:ATP-dependent DNA helicase RecG [Gottschalkia purinilytica]KNF08754.1 ATP-dependent DNA helicase RecG [Gottschalkia purinilytica]
MNKLDTSVQYIKGVGPKKVNLLKKLEIETIRDLIYYFPKGYEDRRELKKITELNEGEKSSIKVVISGLPSIYRARRGLTIIKIQVKDESGMAYLVWFNQDYVTKDLKIGETIKVNGKVKKSGNIIEIHSPIYVKNIQSNDKIGRVLPVYPLTEKLKNNEMIKFMTNALNEYLYLVEESIPEYISERLKLFTIRDSLRNVHFPKNRELYIKSRSTLAFEELLTLQLGLLLMRNDYDKSKECIKFEESKEIYEFIESLPFDLTNAQKRTFKEISDDMESDKQMNRLVQGDVGSGKTILAVLSMFKACKSGYQAVMMAPTEILARQHYDSIQGLLENYNIKCELLISNISNKNKKDIIEKVKSGDIDILIGTHALIEDYVEFKNLGLAITDEQHRFGVKQRAKLSSKGRNPDILVMTATPIPRTLALIMYGDLDISIIDELPPGRKKIKTYVRNESSKDKVYEFVRKQVLEGRQAYIVCPLVEESDSLDIQSAVELYENLKNNEFRDIKVGLLHGKMKGKEKDYIMNEFKLGEIDVLVSTTVIEVGVNVPNSNIMIIENAERFGLAQLHQLRGRVGRGEYQSYCILINKSNSRVSKERMSIMEKTNDGFLISEKDLEIRGPGEFFGIRQHGIPELKIARLPGDIKILKMAQEICFEILKEDPKLELEKNKSIRNKISRIFNKEGLIIFN